uniref:Methyltransferase FkbM domain-containing protein n=1 Tax=viral metagenome TaxID=1070528 RepID=A0A6C0KVA9_9ZZZZ
MSCLGTDRLASLYRVLATYPNSDIHARYEIERPEQEMIAKYLPNECCVLEMGGESGTTSLIINKILKDPTKHVLVEPSQNSIPKLIKTQEIYQTQFKVAHGFVGRNRSSHEALWDECKYRQMFDLCDLEKMVGQPFDVLVVDCEGAFYNILEDMPEILDSVKLIIIEMDGPDDKVPIIRNKLLQNGFEMVHSQSHPYLNNGDATNTEFGVIQNVNDLYKLKCRQNMIGFHEVYIKI